MSDFTLLPAGAAANGFVHDDKDRGYCQKDYCGDFARVHQEIAANARSLHDSLNTDSTQILRGQTDIIKDVCDGSRYVGDKVCDAAQSIKSDLCSGFRDVSGDVHKDGDQTRAAADRNGAETRGRVDMARSELSSDLERNGVETRNRVESSGVEVRSRVEQNGHEIRDDVQRYGVRNAELTERYGLSNRDALDRLSKENALYHKDALLESQKCCCETQKLVQEKTCEISAQEAVHATEMKMLQENARIELLRQADTNRLIIERQASDYHGSVKLQASENFCKLDRAVEMSKHEVKLQAAELASKAEMQSYKQYCDLQKQLSDCCCDLKELVREKHCETDLQFKNLETERLKAELAQAQRQAMEARLQPFPYAQCVSLKSCCGNGNGNGFPPGQQ